MQHDFLSKKIKAEENLSPYANNYKQRRLDNTGYNNTNYNTDSSNNFTTVNQTNQSEIKNNQKLMNQNFNNLSSFYMQKRLESMAHIKVTTTRYKNSIIPVLPGIFK